MTGPADERGSAWRIVVFLLLLHILNQIDRQLVAAFATDIMRDLSLSRGGFAVIASLAFSSVYAVCAVLAGVLADRFGSARVLAGGLGVWSLFTALAGFAQGFWSMLAARPFVAAGEATLVPTATNLILGRVGERHKVAALGLFFAGIPFGVGGSFLIAGVLGPWLGWRATFVALGLVGFVALGAVLRLREAAPSARVPAAAASARGTFGNVAALWRCYLRNPRARWASAALIIANAEFATSLFVQPWLVEEKGIGAAEAVKLYGATFLIAGVLGTFGSGLLVD